MPSGKTSFLLCLWSCFQKISTRELLRKRKLFSCEWASPNLLGAWTEQKHGERGELLSLLELEHSYSPTLWYQSSWFSGLQTQTGFPGSQTWRRQIIPSFHNWVSQFLWSINQSYKLYFFGEPQWIHSNSIWTVCSINIESWVFFIHSRDLVQFSSVAHSCLTLCDPMDCSVPVLPVYHQLPELTQTHGHWSVMPSNHFILCRPLLLQPSIFPSIRVFSNESALWIRRPKYWSFSFNTSPSKEYSRLISFRMDWLDLLAVQGTLKSFLQHHSSKALILRRSAFFIVQLSHPYITTEKP